MFQIFCNHSHFIFVFICYYELSLERFRGELQLCRWKYLNQNSYAKIMIKQNFKHIFFQGNLNSFFLNNNEHPSGKGPS